MENHPQDLAPVHLKDHLRILKRNKWTAVAFFCVVVGLTALYLLFSNPLYSAKVVLVLNPPPFSPLTMMSELIYAQGVDVVSRRLYVTTQFDVIKSRRMAEKVLDRLDLWDVYRVGQRKRGHVWRDPGTVTRERAAEELAKKVSVISPNIMSNSIELTVRNKDPERAARIANTLVEVYLEALYEDRERKIEENLNWLRREFNAIEEEVLQSDQALQDYKRKHNTISVDDREDILTQKLHAMNATLVQARIARIAAENSYYDARQFEEDLSNLENSSLILASNPQIPALQGQLNLARIEYARIQDRYKEKHPRMIELRTTVEELESRIRSEVLAAIETLKINYELALSQENALIEELEIVKEQVIRLGEERIQYLQLLDESVVNRTLFDSLLNRLKETKILLSFWNPLETLQIVDRAVPPSKPGGFRPYFLPVAAAVGLLLGVFLCYVKDYFDDTIRNERDVAETLHLELLSILPHDKGPGLGQAESMGKALFTSPQQPYASFLQRLAGMIQHQTEKENLKSLLIVSACPEEGKSTLTSSLGTALTQRGQKVCLVDGHLRKPALHRIFSVENSSGLTNLLETGGNIQEAVKRTDVENLFCLPAGPTPTNPTQLLSSGSAPRIMEDLKESYDRILIDSAALLEVGDASELARWADAVVWVMRSGETTKEQALWAKKILTLFDSRILGIVLNNVHFLRGSSTDRSGKA